MQFYVKDDKSLHLCCAALLTVEVQILR